MIFPHKRLPQLLQLLQLLHLHRRRLQVDPRRFIRRGPNSLGICTLLDRSIRRIVKVPVEFRCFEIPDRFVVGFGLDYRQLYRNLKYIAVVDKDARLG